MSDFRRAATRQKLFMISLMALVASLAMLLDNQTFYLAMLIGVTISYVNLLVLYRKAMPLAESTGTKGFSKGFGSLTRFATAILGAYITVHYDLDIIGYVIGLIIMYPVIVLDFVLFNRK